MSDKVLMMFNQLQGTSPEATPAGGIMLVLENHLHAVLLGLTLVALTLAAEHLFSKLEEGRTKQPVKFEELIGSFNLMFVLVGMTSTMGLISNSVVRAFAVLAALALVRFRVNLNQKSLSAAMLFAVIMGVACGVGEIALAWISMGFFGLSLLIAVSVVTWSLRRSRANPELAPAVSTAAETAASSQS